MKITQIARFTLVAAALAFALPVRGDTMSVPSKEAPAYTFDVPSSWKPKADVKDESVEATAPGDHAYLSAWIRKGSDSEAIFKDMEATLKDALKSIDEKSSDQTIDVNGTKIMVMKGSGVDKRAGNKVQFRVAIFDAGGGNAGIIYTDYDNDAPDSTMKDIQAIIGSIKVVAKKK
ncbi:MAG: hypothetical protein WAO00_17375 [Chthoniobacterales bacterium]